MGIRKSNFLIPNWPRSYWQRVPKKLSKKTIGESVTVPEKIYLVKLYDTPFSAYRLPYRFSNCFLISSLSFSSLSNLYLLYAYWIYFSASGSKRKSRSSGDRKFLLDKSFL